MGLSDSEEDRDFYGGDDFDYYNNSDDDQYGMSEDEEPEIPKQSYRVLTKSDIGACQEDDITTVSNVLSISKFDAIILLRHYNWRVSEVNDAWFADEDGVRKSVGLLKTPVAVLSKKKKITCDICFDSYTHDKITSVECGHPFCKFCWTSYISISINDGPGCLMLRCPHPSCRAAVGLDMITLLVCDKYKNKYLGFVFRSYVEDNKNIKWCPAPGCENAVDFDSVVGPSDVSCSCSYSFCWSCSEDAHRPVDCSTVSKWIIKNSSESENTNWILSNSKPCPKCKRPIEKNQGCMHMVCGEPCKFHFCWLCLGDWSQHNEKTGGYYACNKYSEAEKRGELDEAEKKREMAKNSLEKYTHYFERWQSNQKSREKAMADLHEMQWVHLEKLSKLHAQPESQIMFVTDAWVQIVECRRVLKWTYAYGYYLPEEEIYKKALFEYLQADAEACLERLHRCAEMELQEYLKDEGEPSMKFLDFRKKLIELTVVTRKFFDNLVKALENGLADVDSYAAASSKRTR